ncbi:MAG: galactose mutarotase [Bacteroidaceae bacterium]|nr:galactose mutarotase [Bacteroidaceae bacterium]
MAVAAVVCCMSAGAAKPKFPLLPTAPYDTIIDGQKVALYTIKKGKVAAQIINYGGFVVGLYSPDKNGEYANLVTHYDDIHQYMRYNMGMVGPALGRYANRIANGKFTLDGKEYNITKNSGQHTLHGGAKGFDHTAWKVVKAKKNKLILSCVLPDGLDGFPGTLTTTLTYSITKDGGLQISYEATTDKATVVNLSNHTYFNLDGVGNGDIMDHQLYINAAFITETDRSNIPTGDWGLVDGSPYDFQKPVRIGDRQYSPAPAQGGGRGGFGGFGQVPEGMVRNYDNNFCLIHTEQGKVEQVATLYSPKSGRFLEVWNNHPGLQVYTGARTAIALESQMYPDSPNHDSFPSTTLRPGEKYQHTVIYKLSVK